VLSESHRTELVVAVYALPEPDHGRNRKKTCFCSGIIVLEKLNFKFSARERQLGLTKIRQKLDTNTPINTSIP